MKKTKHDTLFLRLANMVYVCFPYLNPRLTGTECFKVIFPLRDICVWGHELEKKFDRCVKFPKVRWGIVLFKTKGKIIPVELSCRRDSNIIKR